MGIKLFSSSWRARTRPTLSSLPYSSRCSGCRLLLLWGWSYLCNSRWPIAAAVLLGIMVIFFGARGRHIWLYIFAGQPTVICGSSDERLQISLHLLEWILYVSVPSRHILYRLLSFIETCDHQLNLIQYCLLLRNIFLLSSQFFTLFFNIYLLERHYFRTGLQQKLFEVVYRGQVIVQFRVNYAHMLAELLNHWVFPLQKVRWVLLQNCRVKGLIRLLVIARANVTHNIVLFFLLFSVV